MIETFHTERPTYLTLILYSTLYINHLLSIVQYWYETQVCQERKSITQNVNPGFFFHLTNLLGLKRVKMMRQGIDPSIKVFKKSKVLFLTRFDKNTFDWLTDMSTNEWRKIESIHKSLFLFPSSSTMIFFSYMYEKIGRN